MCAANDKPWSKSVIPLSSSSNEELPIKGCFKFEIQNLGDEADTPTGYNILTDNGRLKIAPGETRTFCGSGGPYCKDEQFKWDTGSGNAQSGLLIIYTYTDHKN